MKVKEIVFKDKDDNYPTFILEDGTEKKPCNVQGNIAWMTEAELNAYNENLPKKKWWQFWK
jgi:hypothetical protein